MSSMNEDKFAQRFEEIRKARNVSVISIAKHLNVADSLLYKYKMGKAKPSYEKLIALANILDVSIDYLVGRTDVPEINKKV
jgi:transcriptional regulator with XRE-family HTH domain